MAQSGGEQRIFLRKASGLIRTASGTDTFIYNLGLVSVGLGVASIMFYGPAYYPWRRPGLVLPAGRRLHGDDRLRLHHLDHHPAAFGRHLRLRLSYPAAGSGADHEPGGDHGLALLLCDRRLLDDPPWGLSPMLTFIGYLTGSDAWVAAGAWVVEPVPLFLIGSGILVLIRHHPVGGHEVLPHDAKDHFLVGPRRLADSDRRPADRLQRGIHRELQYAHGADPGRRPALSGDHRLGQGERLGLGLAPPIGSRPGWSRTGPSCRWWAPPSPLRSAAR